MGINELGFNKGTNLGGWMSQCDYSEDRLDNFIKDSDFAVIKSWGLDHVRLPVDYNVLEEREDGMSRVRRAVDAARSCGLNVVIDLHKTAGYSFDEGENESGFFDNAAYQERFYNLWECLAKEFGDDPGHIMFDILNEITDKGVLDSWQKIAAECVRRIRIHAPETYILVGSYNYNDVRALSDLELPDDEHLVLSFHCYEPHFYTHQGAYWSTDIDRDRRVTFEEAELGEDYFDKLFESALAKSTKESRCLYCGEFGVIDVVPPEDALKWFKAIHKAFEKYDIARAVWSYKEMDFGLADARMDGVRAELLQYL